MTWRALVPFKGSGQAKSRLAGALTPEQRRRLSLLMLNHVVGTLSAIDQVECVGLLSRHPTGDPRVAWIPDRGLGLNAELSRARRAWRDCDILVVHADLPVIAAADILSLLGAAERSGVALAPDRHDTGTNAVAIKAGRSFQFRFGPASLGKHLRGFRGPALVRRPGLIADIDTAEDLRLFRDQAAWLCQSKCTAR